MQLHPDNPSKSYIPTVNRILEEKSIIGLGEWEKGVGTRADFFEKMTVNDLVVIKQGNSPVALVSVVGNAYTENDIDEDLDWFKFRREVKVLDYYHDEYDFKFPQPMGTLSICDDLNNKTSQTIINWHRKVIVRNIMDNIKLSPQRQEDLRILWRQFKDGYSDSECKAEIKEIETLLAQWGEYKAKILDGSLSLAEYTNRKGLDGATLPGGYLCNFLERTTKTKFGSSKPGNANNFEVKLNEDGETYTLRNQLKKGDRENKNSSNFANEFYQENIKPLLKNIVECSEASGKPSIVESSNFPAKQILRKLAVLDHMNEFLFIYSDDMIDALHTEIINS